MVRDPYPRLGRLDFLLSRLGLFRAQTFMLAVKPAGRLYRLKAGSDRMLSLSLEPVGANTHHSVGRACVRYFSATGKQLGSSDQRYSLEAGHGPVSVEVPISPPAHTAWCHVGLSRVRGERPIAARTDWRLERLSSAEVGVLKRPTVDAAAHRKAFFVHKARSNRAAARRELRELIRHYPEPWQWGELRLLEDADHVAAHGFTVPSAPLRLGVTGHASHVLAALEDTDNSHGLPLAKWLAFESLCLASRLQAVGVGVLQVPMGPGLMARLIVAAAIVDANPGLALDLETGALDGGGSLGAWIGFASGEEFLGSPCAEAVRRVLKLD